MVLFVKRPPGGDLSDLWELPGGKVDDDEDPRDALRRELREELSIAAKVGEPVGKATFAHNGAEFTLQGYNVTTDLSGLELREHVELKWCNLTGALCLDLAPSDRKLIEDILLRS